MRTLSFLLRISVIFMFGISTIAAQTTIKPESTVDRKTTEEEEDGPIIFKFEPDYLFSIDARREDMAQTRRILDTMDISDAKRRRLLKDLYKNQPTERLSRALVVENKADSIKRLPRALVVENKYEDN